MKLNNDFPITLTRLQIILKDVENRQVNYLEPNFTVWLKATSGVEATDRYQWIERPMAPTVLVATAAYLTKGWGKGVYDVQYGGFVQEIANEQAEWNVDNNYGEYAELFKTPSDHSMCLGTEDDDCSGPKVHTDEVFAQKLDLAVV